jgi:putative ABC transport system substrate-binding protein
MHTTLQNLFSKSCSDNLKSKIQNLKLLGLLVIVFAFWVAGAEAQQAKKMPRIGWLSASSSSNEFPEKQALDGLRELGWVDGKNIVIEYRYAKGSSERLPQLAKELVAIKVDVIVTFSAGVAAAKRATDTVPIVIGTSQDPVRAGFIASLARPGGNITGVTYLNDELSGKRLELLKEVIPAISRVGILWDQAHVDNEYNGMQAVAPALGIRLQSYEIPRPARPDEVERAVKTVHEAGVRAIVLAPSTFTILNRRRIIELAAKNRLPVISAWRIFAEDGAILTYGPTIFEISRRIAVHVDKVLKGTKPADLPVEQPTRFEMFLNLKTAKQIGLTVPQTVLYRADKVIKEAPG